MKLIVDGQRVYSYSKEDVVASDSIEFVEVEFSFSSEWDGYACVAQFTQNDNTYDRPLKEEQKTRLPEELVFGDVLISVFGYKVGLPNRGTTIPYHLKIQKSGFKSNGSTQVPPSPDLYSQLLEKINTTEKTVVSLEKSAAHSADLAAQGAANAGWLDVVGKEDGYLYFVRSDNAPEDFNLKDDGEGRLVAVYGD